jgi:hypothetical protein
MINAKDAKILYDESGVEVQTFLTYTLEKHIKDAAGSGKRTYTHHIGCEPAYSSCPNPKPLESAIIVELKRLGYTVKFSSYGESFVPASQLNDDGGGPKYFSYGIQIGW